jgi:hypothetical protein
MYTESVYIFSVVSLQRERERERERENPFVGIVWVKRKAYR